jgi:hypothetical protein
MATENDSASPRDEGRNNETLPLTVLLEEYKNLSSSLERLTNIPFTVLTLIAAIGVAFAALGSEKSGLSGLAAAYAIAVGVAWLAFLHSMASGLCLRLMRIELLINRAAKTKDDETVCWYTLCAGSFGRQFPGYQFATFWVTVLGVAVLAISLVSGYSTLRTQFQFPTCLYIAIVALPAISTITLLAGIVVAELGTRRKKRRIFKKLRIKPVFKYRQSTVRLRPLGSRSQGSSDKSEAVTAAQ